VFTLHGTFAILFFLSIAYVCLFRASDTLSLIRDARRARRLRAVYRALGALMVVSPAIAVALSVMLRSDMGPSSALFFVETFAVLTFAAYWLTKSREMNATDAELLALERKLRPAVHAKPADARSPGQLVQVEAD
jgi:hypothetical protein